MHIEKLMERYGALRVCEESVRAACDALIRAYEGGGKLLLAGNGGSCADCDHIVGELMKGFLKRRPLERERREEMRARCVTLDEQMLDKLQGGLPAISLSSAVALGTAFSNDVDATLAFAQATLALGRVGDVFLGISTSGNSENVVAAAKVARGLGMCVIALTGEGGGALGALADIAVCVPERETFMAQEWHLPIYHAICAEVEEHFFKV